MNQKRTNEIFLQIIHCLLKFANKVLKTSDFKFRQNNIKSTSEFLFANHYETNFLCCLSTNQDRLQIAHSYSLDKISFVYEGNFKLIFHFRKPKSG